MPGDLAIVALCLAAYALIAARLDRISIGPAMAFVAIGFALSAGSLGVLTIQPQSEPVKILAEGALALLLFADASSVRTSALRRDVGVVARLLVIGLPLTIAIGTIGASLLFPGISLGLALLVGSALAPTDAALGQPVVTNTAVPPRVRRLLNVESGLNDGIATPFVLFAISLATIGAASPDVGLASAAWATTVGLGVGVVLGGTGGWLLRAADRAGTTSRISRQLFGLALPAACYLGAIAMGGNGFIAAFVGGLAFGLGSAHEEEKAVRVTETIGSVFAIGVWTSFGLVLAAEVFEHMLDLSVITYAVLSLTLFRMAPAALALLGSRFGWPSALFIGWFGPRGVASIVFLILAVDALEAAGVDPGPVPAVMAWTVLLSVIAHGLSAGPLARRYGRVAAAFPSSAPELADDVEPAPRRTEWQADGPSAVIRVPD